MTKTIHTPGPWEFFDALDTEGDPTISIRGDGEFIATMDTCSKNGGPYVLPPKGQANARLIAAAPELLALCKELLDTFPLTDRCCAKIRAIIAKAEGNTV
jgi:hypothetical protein